MILTLWIGLDTIVRIILLSRRGSHCSARSGVAAEGTSRDNKKCRTFDNFQRPVSKMPSQTLEISFSFFFFPGPSIKQLLDWHGQAESRRSRSAGRTSNLKFCVMTGLLGYVSTLIVSGRAECFRSTSTSLLQSVVSYNTLL